MTLLFGLSILLIGGLIGYVLGMRHREWTEMNAFEWEYSFLEYVQRHVHWSLQTFHSANRWDYDRLCRHIEKELEEIRRHPSDCEEWIDVIILAIDGAFRSGHSPAEIALTLRRKQDKNIQRTWIIPEDPTIPIEHNRMEERETNP